jgi:hypothetical protein
MAGDCHDQVGWACKNRVTSRKQRIYSVDFAGVVLSSALCSEGKPTPRLRIPERGLTHSRLRIHSQRHPPETLHRRHGLTPPAWLSRNLAAGPIGCVRSALPVWHPQRGV